MAPVSGPPPLNDEEVAVALAGRDEELGDVGFEEAPVGPVVKELEFPINALGPISGVSKKGSSCDVVKELTDWWVLTSNGLRFEGIPRSKVFALSRTVSMCQKRKITTNGNVFESPLRYACSFGDGVRKSMG